MDEIVARWKSNAAGAGVKLTDEDIARIRESGTIERVQKVEAIIARVDAAQIAPDYLGVLSVYASGNGNSDG